MSIPGNDVLVEGLAIFTDPRVERALYVLLWIYCGYIDIYFYFAGLVFPCVSLLPAVGGLLGQFGRVVWVMQRLLGLPRL